MLDKATVLTTIFTIVDDTMKGSPMIQQALERPGPAPRLCDSEVVTVKSQLLWLIPKLSEPACLPFTGKLESYASVDSNASADSTKILVEARIKYMSA